METYEVIGPRKVLDHEPGETFDADLTVAQIATLTGAGHLRVLKADVGAIREASLNEGRVRSDELVAKAGLLEQLLPAEKTTAKPSPKGKQTATDQKEG